MYVCDYNHDEIVHGDGECPLCSAGDEIDRLNDTISDLDSEIADLTAEGESL